MKKYNDRFSSIMATFWVVMISCTSCSKDKIDNEITDDKGVVTKKAPIWQVANSTGPKHAGGTGSKTLIIDGKFLLDTYADKPEKFSNQIVLLDTETGKQKWSWKDLLREGEEVVISREGNHVFENYLLYHVGPRTFCIDVNSGKTAWKHWNTYQGMPNCRMLGNLYFTNGTPLEKYNQGTQEGSVFMGDIRTGDYKFIVTPKYDLANIRPDQGFKQHVGYISEVQPVVEGRDTLLIVTFNQSHEIQNKFKAFVGLYNMSKKEWVYEREPIDIPINEAFNGSWLTLKGEKMYNVLNNAIACTNWKTGKKVWAKPFSSFAQLPKLIDDNKYLAVLSTDSKLFLLDADTGTELWMHRETVGGAEFYFDKGILYYQTGRLCAREIPSGKKLWEISAPTEDVIDGSFWVFVNGIPGKNGEKGRIFTRSSYHTYCYEAIR